MLMAFKITVTVLMQITWFCSECYADCSKDVIGFNEKLFVLSDKKADAQSAAQSCESLEGVLAPVSDEDEKSGLIHLMEQKYTKGLGTIRVHENPDSTRIRVKYRYSEGGSDTASVSTWKTPEKGQVRSFKVHKSAGNDFQEAVSFCYRSSDPSDYMRLKPDGCEEWSMNFEAYISRREVGNSLLLLRQIFVPPWPYNNPWVPRVLFPNKAIPSEFEGYKHNNPVNFYIPEINVYIGARKQANAQVWMWSNATVTNDMSFPGTEEDSCQNLAWPVTYDDGINLTSQECSLKAYYACQFQLLLTVDQVECNGSSLEVSWKYFNFTSIVSSTSDLYLQVRIPESNVLSERALFQESNLVITGLTKRTRYSMVAFIKTSNCENLVYNTTLLGTTGYGLPDAVRSAYVDNTTNLTGECYITWEYDPYDVDIERFKIHGNGQLVLDILREDLNTSNNLTTHFVDLALFESNMTVQFRIQAISCEGNGKDREVVGNCQTAIVVNPTGNGQLSVGAMVGIALAVLFAIVVLLGFILHRRRFASSPQKAGFVPQQELFSERTKKGEFEKLPKHQPPQQPQAATSPTTISEKVPKTATEDIYENTANIGANATSNKIPVKDLEYIFVSECENGFPNLKAEFQAIVKSSSESGKLHEIASKVENKKFNRYKNIYPIDHSRVMLPSKKYINASHLKRYAKGKLYIATQGPKPSTVEDFWELVWTQGSSIIVMLCNCNENGKVKCEQYWPTQDKKKSCGGFKVENILEQNFGATIKRTLLLTNFETEEKRRVLQFHFIAWPDHDIPITTSGIVMLRKLVNDEAERQATDTPIVVHCSAGAGRTGTYIAFDNCLEELKTTGKVDIASSVSVMRENRKDMVQTQNQYNIIYKLLVESLILPETQLTMEEFENNITYNDWETVATEEFNFLEKQAIKSCLHNSAPSKPEDAYQNEEKSNGDINQVKIKRGGTQVRMDAHYIRNDFYPASIIASSLPKQRKQSDFWKMAAFNNSRIVLALENMDRDVIQTIQQETTLENITITVEQAVEKGFYLERNLAICLNDDAETPFTLTHITLHSWEEDLPEVNHLVDIIYKVKSSMATFPGSSALVYCKDGCIKTGVFLAFAQIIEEFNCGMINILRAVKDLRDMRNGIICREEQYKQCYLLTNDYYALLQNDEVTQPYAECN